MTAYRPLKKEEIQTLESRGCSASDWSAVTVAEGFDPSRLLNVELIGKVSIGVLKEGVKLSGEVTLPSEIRNATIANCKVGDNVRISNVNGHIANYEIGAGAVITNVGVMATNPGATFGNGTALETINEGGGREVRIYNDLSSQFAYIIGMHRYRPNLVGAMEKMVDKYVASVKSDLGKVGAGAIVEDVPQIIDVNIGEKAVVSGAIRLTNGTILSEKCAPTTVGSAVVADDFIIAEGSKVDSGVVLGKCFIGQGVKAGKQFSGENSLFFANCECFHSEACSVFGGPYTVTHHRSTLLIAAVFSFYNAGSGTNQSNHMYKLGPVHQGALERGSKTGSFSYMLWPCIISPFSVVIGKNMANFDISEFPFSYVTAEAEGSFLTPAMNMFTVGTTRDGEKWPNRDRRKASRKRDQIRFEVYSPFTVGRMVKGEAVLRDLAEKTDRKVEIVRYKGVVIKRLMLKTSAKNYAQAIDRYLFEKILEKADAVLANGIDAVRKAFAPAADAVYTQDWADISGLLISRGRLDTFESAVESGKIGDITAFQKAIEEACAAYPKDEWAWVRENYKARHGKSVEELTLEDIESMRAAHTKAKSSLASKILGDAQKEFDETSRIGFGADGTETERDAEFTAVRGTYEGNSFVKKMQAQVSDASAAKS